MKVLDLTPGCKLLVSNTMSFLFGCVAEAVKFIQHSAEAKDAPPLCGIVLPDTMMSKGVANFAPEFPLYKFLFVEGGLAALFQSNFAEDRKFQIIGTAKQLARARKILEITLFVPSSKQFQSWSRRHAELRQTMYRQLQRSCGFFRLKGLDGEPLAIDDLVSFREFPVSLEDGSVVTRLGKDRFQIVAEDGSVKDVTLDGSIRPAAPFAIIPAESVHQTVGFGVRVLSYGNGFDHRGGCTAILVWLNGVPLLVDAAPYVSDMLTAHGISPKQLGGLLLTHVHDDHCGGVLELLHARGQLPLYATAEVYESLLIKLAALLDCDLSIEEKRQELCNRFEWHQIVVGCPHHIFGVRAIAHYTAHSIPTIGVRFVSERNGARRELLIVGDNAGFSKLDQMFQAEALNKAWYEQLKRLITGREELVIVDGGGDPAGLHADPCDPEFVELTKRMEGRLYFGHRIAAPVASPHLPIAKAGLFIALHQSVAPHCDQLVVAETLESLGVKPRLAAIALMYQSSISEYPAGSEIVSIGRETRGYAYIVLGGCLAVRDKLRCLATLGLGDLFGEIAVLDGTPRCATVQAVSAVRLLEIPGSCFAQLVQEHNLLALLEKRWMAQRLASQVELFHSLPAEELVLLEEYLTSRVIEPGTEIIVEGEKSNSLYILSCGEVEVTRGGKVLAILRAGSVFGETAALGASPLRTATVRAGKNPCSIHELPASSLWSANGVGKTLEFRLRALMLERSVG